MSFNYLLIVYYSVGFVEPALRFWRRISKSVILIDAIKPKIKFKCNSKLLWEFSGSVQNKTSFVWRLIEIFLFLFGLLVASKNYSKDTRFFMYVFIGNFFCFFKNVFISKSKEKYNFQKFEYFIFFLTSKEIWKKDISLKCIKKPQKVKDPLFGLYCVFLWFP